MSKLIIAATSLLIIGSSVAMAETFKGSGFREGPITGKLTEHYEWHPVEDGINDLEDRYDKDHDKPIEKYDDGKDGDGSADHPYKSWWSE